MKITLTWLPPGSSQPSNLVIVDSPANIQMTDLWMDGDSISQEVQLFRSAARKYYDRGNKKAEITFNTTRLYPDQKSAEVATLTLFASMPNQASVTFLAGSGSQTATLYLKNAIIKVRCSPPGFTTFQSYRITGGIVSNSPN